MVAWLAVDTPQELVGIISRRAVGGLTLTQAAQQGGCAAQEDREGAGRDVDGRRWGAAAGMVGFTSRLPAG